jgi:hypothetical protein
MKSVTRSVAHASLLLVALSLAGCDSNAGLGKGAGGLAGLAGTTGASAGSAGASPTGTAATTGGIGGATGAKADPATLGPLQSWTGTIDGFSFHSGSDALALTFAADATGIAKGTIVFGMGTPPPPATDPNVAYPPDLFDSTGLLPPDPDDGVALAYVAEEYPYAFDGGSFEGNHLRFIANLFQLWTGWCALQTPSSDGWGDCLPPPATWGGGRCTVVDPQTKQDVLVDCGQLALCTGGGGPCACTASGCGLSALDDDVIVDIIVTGNTASGSIAGSIFGTDNVHLVKN